MARGFQIQPLWSTEISDLVAYEKFLQPKNESWYSRVKSKYLLKNHTTHKDERRKEAKRNPPKNTGYKPKKKNQKGKFFY